MLKPCQAMPWEEQETTPYNGNNVTNKEILDNDETIKTDVFHLEQSREEHHQ